jgi:XTP/dITP diphosphohydrolase
MHTLLIATRNAHKVAEIQGILGHKFRYLSLTHFPGAPNVIEDAGSFAGNATKKAIELAKWVGGSGPREDELLVLADDSGLEVDALGGRPGVNSARFAALDSASVGNSPDAENNAKLLRLLEGVPPAKRAARFRCVLALTPVLRSAAETSSPVCYADEWEMRTELFEGTCEGRIQVAPRGSNGFGYDPLFIPNGYERSFAELGETIKNRLSHRANALGKLKVHLNAHDPR